MYISHPLVLLLYPYRASFGIMAFSTSFIFLLVLTAQLALCQQQQQQQVTVTHIRAGNGSGSLTDYLHTGSLQFPSFTTPLFSPGVHDMCEERVVVIRDVTSIALIGSDSTHTRSVQVGGGKVVEVTEPSTVIDCHGCPTGFAFVNVSGLILKQIQLVRCGGKGGVNEGDLNHLLIDFDSTASSSLTLMSIHTLLMETVMFKNTGTVYSIIALNILGISHIVNTSVFQEIHKDSSSQISALSNISGCIFLRVYDNAMFSVISTNILHTVDREFQLFQVPLFTLDLTFINEGRVYLNRLNVHVKRGNNNYLEPYIAIRCPQNVSNYQVFIHNVWFTSIVSGPNIYAMKFTFQNSIYLFIPNYSTLSTNGYTEISNIDLEGKCRMEIFAYQTKSVRTILFPWDMDYETEDNADMTESLHKVFFHHCKVKGLHILSLQQLLLISVPCSNLRNTIDESSTNIQLFINSTEFSGNANFDGIQSCRSGGILLVGVSDVFISNCTFSSHMGSGLYLIESTATFSGNNTFYNNTAKYGGGILIDSRSFLSISPHTTLNFTENVALVTGGAIHVMKHDTVCFLKLGAPLDHTLDGRNYTFSYQYNDVNIIFNNNSAGVAGSAVWGGSLDRLCKNFLPIFHVSNDATDPSALSSSPDSIYFCYCNDTGIYLNFYYLYWQTINMFPGETIEVRVALTGQMDGLVPGLVQAQLVSREQFELNELQKTQRIRKAECTTLNYTLYSASVEHHNELKLELPKSPWHDTFSLYDDLDEGFAKYIKLILNIFFVQCPIGFQLWPSIGSCNCLQPLIKYTSNASCDINTQTVERTASLWMNASYTGNNTQTLAVHQHCPFDYCDPNKLRVDLSSPDQQCAHNRSGILCGGCRRGLSLTLGSPKCRRCSNNFLSLMLAFAAAGLALVAVLICLNLTVSVGTINALILYANIVRALHPVFFPSTTFLSVFVAWLNLDIGLESCFYDGLDFYSLTWLQFVFPVYIWLLVGVMILTSHYSTTAAKLVSRDAVKVLATLFLLSYAKLLRTILTVLSFTYISYEDTDGATHRTAVWLYDGNVEFGRGKHIPLILAALSFGVLYIIPFTLLLLLAPFLQTRSHYTALRWVNKLMPFLDAYQGPYSKRFRFWPGALLLVRVILLVTFALNSLGDPHMNLILIVTILVCLLSLQWLLGVTLESAMPYRHAILSYLDAFYLVNLGVLSAWSLLETNNATSSLKTQNIVTYVLVGLAFMVSLCILVAHIYLQAKKVINLNKFWQKIKQRNDRPPVNTPHPQATCQEENQQPQREVVTTTFIDLREPLLTD